jgi:Domain of unknown function (DUF4389)
MTENTDTSANKRNVWVRGFFMLLMVFVFQVSATLMFAVTVIQFVMMLLNGTANARLISFGRSLGEYFQQIVNFMTFASEEIPFPFSDWPSAGR